MAKKGATRNFPPLCSIEQNDSLTLLGVTLQNDCKFSSHVKRKKNFVKPQEAHTICRVNDCYFIVNVLDLLFA